MADKQLRESQEAERKLTTKNKQIEALTRNCIYQKMQFEWSEREFLEFQERVKDKGRELDTLRE